MTPTSAQLAAITERIVAQALAECRQRAIDDETAARCIRLAQDAADARFWALVKTRRLREEWTP